MKFVVEMQRRNITPRAFYSAVDKALFKKTNGIYITPVKLEDIFPDEEFNEWKNGRVNDPNYARIDKDDEIYYSEPFNFHLAGDSYNYILEFVFDSDTRGHGYAYFCDCGGD